MTTKLLEGRKSDRELADILGGRFRFPKRTVYTCDRDGNAVTFVPWPMQIRMWLGLGCPTCKRKGWLFSCRYGYCEKKR